MNGDEMRDMPAGQALLVSFLRFCAMFFGSALLGICAGLTSALVSTIYLFFLSFTKYNLCLVRGCNGVEISADLNSG